MRYTEEVVPVHAQRNPRPIGLAMSVAVWGRISALLEMIKFSHTVFALPFALTGMVLAARGVPSARVVVGILLSMVGARTAAMAWNRIADAEIDARNPRTAGRHLPAGLVQPLEAWSLAVGGALLLLAAAWYLNPLCLALSPLALAVIIVYPYTKRFTAFCHFTLGLALAAAPLGAWVAVTGQWSWRLVPLGFAVLVWTAGFDVLYALQDFEFDCSEGLYSIPRRLGIGGSLRVAARLHILLVLLLALQIPLFGLGLWYGLGVAAVAALLLYEHSLVTPSDLSRLDAAFFTMNGVISLVIFVATFVDVIL